MQLTGIAAGTAATGIMLGGCPDEPDPDELLDVAIIGGGLSGLSAARELVAQGVDRVAVLEARERVGGRTLGQAVMGGEIVDGGGQWIGPTQTEVAALAEELGIETFPTYTAGERLIVIGGIPVRESEFSPTPEEVADLDQAIAGLDALARTIPVEAPWDAPDAASLDSMTMAQWLEANTTTDAARDEIGGAIATTLSASPDQLSLLYFAFYIASAGSYHLLEDIAGGAQETRMVGGTQQMSSKMAEQLGGRVRLGSPVESIEQREDRVIITTRRATVAARRVIVAMMPSDCKRLQVVPELPRARRDLIDGWTASSGFKAHAVYDTPFWRADDLNGQGININILGDTIVEVTFDNSPRDGSSGILLAFVNIDNAPNGAEARKAAVIDDLVGMFGEQAANPRDYVEQDWSRETFTSGCVSPLRPGFLSTHGPELRRPAGFIHWAGTETSTIWTGYMEGAIRSGKRAAREVIDALG